MDIFLDILDVDSVQGNHTKYNKPLGVLRQVDHRKELTGGKDRGYSSRASQGWIKSHRGTKCMDRIEE